MVFVMESHYICPFGYRLALCIKKFVKNTLTLTTRKSFLGVRLSLSHTHIDKHPRHFLLESPPPPPPPGVDAAYAFENGYITANESLHTPLFTFLSNS